MPVSDTDPLLLHGRIELKEIGVSYVSPHVETNLGPIPLF